MHWSKAFGITRSAQPRANWPQAAPLFRNFRQCNLLICACCLFISIASSSLFAATVLFQGKTYDVGVITPSATTPAFSNNDLIFLQDTGGNKFLVIPGDTTIRG